MSGANCPCGAGVHICNYFFTVGTYLRYIHKGLKLRDNTKGLERPRDHGVLIFFRTSTGDFTEGMTWTLRAAVSCTKKKP